MNSTKFNTNCTFSTSNFRICDKLSIIIVYHKSLSTFNKTEKFGALSDESYWVFQVKNMRSVPVWKIINITLVCSRDNKIVPSDWHVDNSIFEIEEFAHFCQNISDDNSVFIIKISLPVAVVKLFIYNLAKDDISASTWSCAQCAIWWPRKFFNGSNLGLVKWISPTCLITEFEHSKATYRKILSIRTPRYWVNYVIVWGRWIQIST